MNSCRPEQFESQFASEEMKICNRRLVRTAWRIDWIGIPGHFRHFDVIFVNIVRLDAFAALH